MTIADRRVPTRRLAAAAAAISLCLPAPPAAAQTAAGDWTGTITVNVAETLREAIHIRKTPDGGYAGALDSLDRAAYGLPLADVAVKDGVLSFTLPVKPPGRFAGKWDAASGTWIGQWTQSGASLPLTLAPGTAAPMPVVAGLDGAWDGVLDLGGGRQLHLTLHVRTGRNGTAAWLDSVDQLSYGLTVNDLRREGDKIGFDLTALHAGFAGVLGGSGASLAGQWTQGGRSLPVTFTLRAPGAEAPKLIRPQTPVKPYPYREEEVAFDDPAAAHVRLAGALTLPQGPGPFPAAVLISGSGPNTRNEPILGHQIFLVLADYLTRHGVAVLRYDKRGTGDSTGDYAHATSLDFANDAEAAAAYLRGRKEIDPRRVGLIGHSEGGLIAPIVAARDPGVAFIVMMAGPGVDGADLLMEQGRLIAKAEGEGDAEIAQESGLRAQLFAIVRAEKDPAAASAKLAAALGAYAKAHSLPEAGLEAQAGQINSDWFRFFFGYDPAPTLRKLRCPVLALDGSKDLQVPPDQNLPPIRAALAGDPRAEVLELPGLNHLFQPAKTGSPGEYGRIEVTIAPEALATITDWILAQAPGRR